LFSVCSSSICLSRPSIVELQLFGGGLQFAELTRLVFLPLAAFLPDLVGHCLRIGDLLPLLVERLLEDGGFLTQPVESPLRFTHRAVFLFGRFLQRRNLVLELQVPFLEFGHFLPEFANRARLAVCFGFELLVELLVICGQLVTNAAHVFQFLLEFVAFCLGIPHLESKRLDTHLEIFVFERQFLDLQLQ
jgi:hypothetical protein